MLNIVCPVCFRPQSSRPIERDGTPWIEWYCADHGALWFTQKSEWQVTPGSADQGKNQMTLPNGYIELTNTADGKRFALDARGLVVTPMLGVVRIGQKFACNCTVGPVADTDHYWTVVENYGEVMAKLAVALGAREGTT